MTYFTININEYLHININKVNQVKDVIYFEICGYIDSYNSCSFIELIEKEAKEGYVKHIWDLKNMYYFSPIVGFGHFRRLLMAIIPKGGDIVLINANDKILPVLH